MGLSPHHSQFAPERIVILPSANLARAGEKQSTYLGRSTDEFRRKTLRCTEDFPASQFFERLINTSNFRNLNNLMRIYAAVCPGELLFFRGDFLVFLKSNVLVKEQLYLFHVKPTSPNFLSNGMPFRQESQKAKPAEPLPRAQPEPSTPTSGPTFPCPEYCSSINRG